MIARILVFALTVGMLAPHAFAADAAAAQQRVKEKVLQSLLSIPAGSPVEVQLKGAEKFEGKMGDLSGNSFAVQRVSGGEIVDQTVNVDDVQKIRVKQKGGLMQKVLGVTSLLTLVGTVATLATN